MSQANSQIESLRTAGFTPDEIGTWAADKRSQLSAAGFDDGEIDNYFGAPDTKSANTNLATAVAKTLQPAWQTVKDLATVYAPIEASLNVATGMGLGFPAYLAGGLGTVVGRAAGLTDEDPKTIANKFAQAMTFTPYSTPGKRLAATITSPLAALTDVSETAGKKVADVTGSPTAAALTESTIQMLPALLVGPLGRAIAGKAPTPLTFSDAARTVTADEKIAPVVNDKLRAIYEKTGVDPEAVLETAQKDVTVSQDMLSKNVDVPKSIAEATGIPSEKRINMTQRESIDALPEDQRGPATDAIKELQQQAHSKFYEANGLLRAGKPEDQARAEQLMAEGDKLFEQSKQPVEQPTAVATPIDSLEPFKPAKYELEASGGKPADAGDAAMVARALSIDERAVEKLAGQFETSGSDFMAGIRGFLDEHDKSGNANERSATGQSQADIGQGDSVSNAGAGIGSTDGTGTLSGTRNAGSEPSAATAAAKAAEAGGVGKPPEPPRPPESPEPSDAQKQVLSRIVQEDHKQLIPTFRQMYTGIVDRLNPIKMAMRDEGVKLPTSRNPYDLERLTAGVFGKGKQFITKATFDFDTYKDTGKSYEAIMEPVKNDMDGFRAYMASRRAVELEGRGIDTGIPIDAAKAVIADGAAKYEPVFQDRLAYRGALLDYLEKSGILNKETRAAMEEANKAYVPFYRYFEEQPRAGTAKVVRNPIKQIEGSERQILDPITSDIKDTFLFMQLAEKNAARQAFVGLGKNFAEKVKQPLLPVKLQEGELRKILGDSAEFVDPKVDTIFRAVRSTPAKDEVVVFDNGKPSTYKVDPDVAEAFNATDKTTAGFLANMLNTPASLLRAGVTLSPDFMPRNMIRDAVSAFVYAGSHPIKTIKGAVHLGLQDTAFQNWMKGGGSGATMVSMDRNYISQHLFELNAETGLMKKAWNVLKTPVEILRSASEFVENATRVGSVGDEMAVAKDKAAIQALALISREATVDFARRGSNPFLASYSHQTAFMNPGIQGIDRMYRAIKENPQGTLAKSFIAITIPSLLLWWQNHDKQWFQDIPRWQKDFFWTFSPDDGKTIMRIPKPFELGVLFGSLPERLMDAFVADTPDAMKGIDSSISQAFYPNLIPTWASPVIEQFSNRSLFTGQPLIPKDVENQLPEYRYNTYTTELAKKLGGELGAFPGMKEMSIGNEGSVTPGVARALTSPALIEHYVQAWSGGLGMYFLKAADLALRKTGQLPDPVNPTDALADIPFVKAFVVRYPSAGAQPIQDFYDAYGQHKMAADTIMAQAKQGNIGAVNKEMKFDPVAFMQLEGIHQALGETAQLVRLIYKNPEMTPDDKRQIIDTLYFRMTELGKAGNDAMKQSEANAKRTLH